MFFSMFFGRQFINLLNAIKKMQPCVKRSLNDLNIKYLLMITGKLATLNYILCLQKVEYLIQYSIFF